MGNGDECKVITLFLIQLKYLFHIELSAIVEIGFFSLVFADINMLTLLLLLLLLLLLIIIMFF